MQGGISVIVAGVSRAREFDEIANGIGLGSMEQDDKALARLRSLAQDVGEAEGWNRYALALYAAHRHLQAGDVLRHILKAVDSNAYHLNLAAAYSQVAFVDLCCQSALNSFQATASKSFQLVRPVSAAFCAA
jgi:hypothetical protein